MDGTLIKIEVEGVMFKAGLAQPPALSYLERHIGGPLRPIPQFLSWRGDPCRAFRAKDYDLSAQPNLLAQFMWEASLGCEIFHDLLRGTVVIVVGDGEMIAAIDGVVTSDRGTYDS